VGGGGEEWGNTSTKAFGFSVADRPKAKKKKLHKFVKKKKNVFSGEFHGSRVKDS
jgi:hypothetical protein